MSYIFDNSFYKYAGEDDSTMDNALVAGAGALSAGGAYLGAGKAHKWYLGNRLGTREAGIQALEKKYSKERLFDIQRQLAEQAGWVKDKNFMSNGLMRNANGDTLTLARDYVSNPKIGTSIGASINDAKRQLEYSVNINPMSFAKNPDNVVGTMAHEIGHIRPYDKVNKSFDRERMAKAWMKNTPLRNKHRAALGATNALAIAGVNDNVLDAMQLGYAGWQTAKSLPVFKEEVRASYAGSKLIHAIEPKATLKQRLAPFRGVPTYMSSTFAPLAMAGASILGRHLMRSDNN